MDRTPEEIYAEGRAYCKMIASLWGLDNGHPTYAKILDALSSVWGAGRRAGIKASREIALSDSVESGKKIKEG